MLPEGRELGRLARAIQTGGRLTKIYWLGGVWDENGMTFAALGLLARLALIAVFAVAGASKLRDRQSVRSMLVGFGVPVGFAPAAGLALPAVELITAAALATPAVAWLGGLAALLLLLAFTIAIAVNLLGGRRPDCNCFGQIEAAPIGVTTLIRNGVLLLAAALVVAVGPTSAAADPFIVLTELAADPRAGRALGLAATGLLVWCLVLLLQISKRQAVILARLEGRAAEDETAAPAVPTVLPMGAPAPPFELEDIQGGRVGLKDLTASGRPLLLIFTSSGCGHCKALEPEIKAWERVLKDVLTIVRVHSGAPPEAPGEGPLLLDRDRRVVKAYGVRGTPAAVKVRSDNTIGGDVAGGDQEIRALVNATAREAAEALRAVQRAS